MHPTRSEPVEMLHTRPVAEEEFFTAEGTETSSSGRSEGQQGFGNLRPYVPRDILDVSFPVAVRGYDRRVVDSYVKRVNRAIAELKVSASPPAAVRHALEQAGQQVHGLLQSARETAEEITASARQEAEESIDRAKAQAADLVVNSSVEADQVRAEADALLANARTEADAMVANAKTEAEDLAEQAKRDAEHLLEQARADAEKRLRRSQKEVAALYEEAEARKRELTSDTNAVWDERGQLLDGIRELATDLVSLADAAAARVARQDSVRDEAPAGESQAQDELEPLDSMTLLAQEAKNPGLDS
jgi:DivIVA domain-containing protein